MSEIILAKFLTPLELCLDLSSVLCECFHLEDLRPRFAALPVVIIHHSWVLLIYITQSQILKVAGYLVIECWDGTV